MNFGTRLRRRMNESGAGSSPASPDLNSLSRQQSPQSTEQGSLSILDSYVEVPPSGENSIRIFAGEWSSRLPPPYSETTGKSDLFEDGRITWLSDVLGGFKGLRVLELGPLEAGHTTMLERGGADSILAVESNMRAYLKCLIVKELLDLHRARFLLGDFVSYLRESSERFDLCVASGILYHMQEPVEVLDLISQKADLLLLSTHYFDEGLIASEPAIAEKFSSAEDCVYGDFHYVRHKYHYGAALQWQGFCGGAKPFSYWLSRHDILSTLRLVGYNELIVGMDHPDHQNGPAFGVIASKAPLAEVRSRSTGDPAHPG
jgi:hypothetical protein